MASNKINMNSANKSNLDDDYEVVSAKAVNQTRKNTLALHSVKSRNKLAVAHMMSVTPRSSQSIKIEAGLLGTGLSFGPRRFTVGQTTPIAGQTTTLSWSICFNVCPFSTDYLSATVPTIAAPIFPEYVLIYDNWRMTSFDIDLSIGPVAVALSDNPNIEVKTFDVYSRVIPSVVALNLPTFNSTLPQFFESGGFTHHRCNTYDSQHNVKVHWRMDDTNSNLWGNTGSCSPYYNWYVYAVVVAPFQVPAATTVTNTYIPVTATGMAHLGFKTVKIADV